MKQAIIIFALVLTSFVLNAHTDSYTLQQTTGSIVMIDAVMLVSSGTSDSITEIQLFTTDEQLKFTFTGCLTNSCAYVVAHLPANTYQILVTLNNGRTFTQKVVLT